MPQTELSRFLFSRGHFAPTKNRVKPGAMLPNRDGELSVFKTDHLTPDEVWDRGLHVKDLARQSTLYGRDVFPSSALDDKPLRFVLDDDPPDHSNVLGWPADKPSRKMLASELASAATYDPHSPSASA